MEEIGEMHLESCDLFEEEELDAKIRAYASNPKRWPHLSQRELCLLHHRLDHAHVIVEQLAAAADFCDPPKPPLWSPPASFGDTLTWLLIVCWDVHGGFLFSERKGLLAALESRRKWPDAPLPDDPGEGFAA
jgi:hypothetical protein